MGEIDQSLRRLMRKAKIVSSVYGFGFLVGGILVRGKWGG